MRIAVQSPCQNGSIDGTVEANILRHLRNAQVETSDLVIIPISFYGDFKFNAALPHLLKGKRWVMMDFLELGLDWDVNSGTDTHVLGRNSANFPRVSGPEWMKFDAFTRDHPPSAYFKRELLAREQTDWLIPVDFPCYVPIPWTQTKAEFETRPIEVFHFWGLSHLSRPKLHGNIFKYAYGERYEVISQFGHWNGYFADPRGRTWASVHAPHFDRKPIAEVMHFTHRSKISVSLPGAGVKCFRDSEAPCGSTPAFWDCGIARSYPWTPGENCIGLAPNAEWEHLRAAVQLEDLYEIYVAAQETIRKYDAVTYAKDYLLTRIQNCL